MAIPLKALCVWVITLQRLACLGSFLFRPPHTLPVCEIPVMPMPPVCLKTRYFVIEKEQSSASSLTKTGQSAAKYNFHWWRFHFIGQHCPSLCPAGLSWDLLWGVSCFTEGCAGSCHVSLSPATLGRGWHHPRVLDVEDTPPSVRNPTQVTWAVTWNPKPDFPFSNPVPLLLDQGSARYSAPAAVVVNKVLLKRGHIHLLTCCLWWLSP